MVAPAVVVEPDRSATIGDPVGFLPGDAQLAMWIDLDALRASAVWATYRAKVVAALGARLTNFVAKCGFDPLEAVKSIAIGLADFSEKEGVFVIRGLDRDRTIRCLEQHALGDDTITSDHGVVSILDKSGALNLLTFVGPTTLVMVGSGKPTVETLQRAVATDRPLRDDGEVVALLGKLARGAMFSMVGRGAFTKRLTKFGVPPRTVAMSVHATDGFAGAIDLTFPTPVEADHVAHELDEGLDRLSMFEKHDVVATGDRVHAELVINREALADLVAAFGSAL
jgi:hypothetical protein